MHGSEVEARSGDILVDYNYTRSYDETHPLICMDEGCKQQVEEVRTPLPVKPGEPERYDSEYERNGVSHLFMMFEPLNGKRFVDVTERRSAVDWAHQGRASPTFPPGPLEQTCPRPPPRCSMGRNSALYLPGPR